MRFAVAALSALALAGCAGASHTTVRLPDGSAAATVKCVSDPHQCFERASHVCASTGGTYKVIRSKSNAGGAIADVLPGPFTWYTMTFACGASDGVLPDFAFTGERYSPPPVTTTAPTRTTCTKIGDTVNCRSN